jgi:hypothetical protein
MVFRVKIMVWRRYMEDLLHQIDEVRHSDTGIFSLRGSTGVKRIRPEYGSKDWPRSYREPPQNLPYSLFNSNWFHQVEPAIRQATLHVTPEEFTWLKTFPTR